MEKPTLKDGLMEDLLNFPERVDTGNGYANDLVATANDRLKRTIHVLALLIETFKTESKHIRGTIRELENTIEKLNEKSGKLQITILWLTFVTAFAALVQIFIAIKLRS